MFLVLLIIINGIGDQLPLCRWFTNLDRNGLLCNNVIEVENSVYGVTNRQGPMYNARNRILAALPSLPQWLAIYTGVLSNTLDFSVYVRTAVYMLRYPGLSDLMRLDGVTLLPGKYTNVINGLAYGFVALDTVFDVYSNIQSGKPAGYVIGSAAYTAATGAGIVWTSGKVGEIVGTLIGGAAGAILGGIAGIVVGGLLTLGANLLKGELFK